MQESTMLDGVAVDETCAKLLPLTEASYRQGQLFFLQPDYVAKVCDDLGFEADLRKALHEGLAMFAENPSLERIVWHCHCLLFREKQVPAITWPVVSPAIHAAADLFYAYVLLSGLEHVRSAHREKGIDEAVTRETLSDLLLWLRLFHELYGRWGLDRFDWLSLHFTGRLFRLGRLQYNFSTFSSPLRAYRNRQTRKVVVLCETGLKFRADGQFVDADGRMAPVAWESRLEEGPDSITGTAVSPLGAALPERIALRKGEWECVLRKGDPVLGVHIPATGPMDHASCGESFVQAVNFFPRHFPEHPFRAFTCSSWLLDPQLAAYLPKSSNITLFLKEFYLHPNPGANANQTFERVFGFGVKPDADIESLPQKSSLQRTLVQQIRNGVNWRGGGALLFPEDLAWGKQLYWQAFADRCPQKLWP